MIAFDAGQFSGEYQSRDGRKLWSLLNREEVAARMETASDLGYPALAAVEEILLQEMNAVILQDRFKQMAGRMVRQIMEARGFDHETSDIRLNSVPFYKASRYRRRELTTLYLFKNAANPRDICLTDTRKGEKLPDLPRGRWIFVNTLSSRLKAQIGYGLDLTAAAATVARSGFRRHTVERLLQAG
jgi:hypothetical protein